MGEVVVVQHFEVSVGQVESVEVVELTFECYVNEVIEVAI